jgi:tetratricopeptide (TPR) repeat protein
LQNLSQAIANFRKVIFLDPLQPKGYHLMASALVTVDHANEIYQVAKTAPSELPVAVNGLAWILATHPNAEYRNGVEALQFAQETLLLTPQIKPQFLNTLSVAYAAVGNFPEAIQTAQRAMLEASSLGPKGLSQKIQMQISQYNKKEPFHFTTSDSK